jgi:hypothetical protein
LNFLPEVGVSRMFVEGASPYSILPRRMVNQELLESRRPFFREASVDRLAEPHI